MATIYKRDAKSDEILRILKDEIEKNNGIIKREQVKALGIDYRRVLDFVETGDLVRVKNGYYSDTMDRFTEAALISALFPDGVLCQETALYLQGYIVEKPFAWKIAIDKNTSKARFAIDYPKVIPNYTENESLMVGAEKFEYEGNPFYIYNKERLICDCLKYETKMERAVYQEALRNYIADPEKDIARLMEYARIRMVAKKVQNIIGVWI